MEDKKGTSEKEETIEINFGKMLGSFRKNPWIVASIVLAVFLVVVLVGDFGSGGAKVSADEAAANVINFINSNPNAQGQATLVSSQRNGQFYEVVLNYQGGDVSVFVTLDGEFLFTELVPIG
ncbi:MAG: hypothetical protein KC506_02995 [Nanoarchaeota archaeon]|nr:hypothetical protein [Nanoarchaeota archaeon]